MARTRAAELRARLESSSGCPSRAEAALLAEELEVVGEELNVADDELRRQNEELLQARLATLAERERYVDLFESAPDPYFVTDRFGTIQEANHAAALALQMTASFLVGKPLVSFVARSDCKKLRAALARLARGEPIQNLDLRVRPRRQRPIFIAEISASATRGLGGRAACIRWQMRDVTGRRKAADGEEGPESR